jgi:hypothetical protein
MLLPVQEAQRFFRLYPAVLVFINQRLQVLPDRCANGGGFDSFTKEERLKLREAFVDHPELLDAFVAENPAGLNDDDLATVALWRHRVAGQFYVIRELKKYTVFLSATDPAVAYGVLALTQPLEELIGPCLPVLSGAVLLPFEGKIVYDGLLANNNISFGPGIRRMLNDTYQTAKARMGIVTSLPVGAAPPRKARPAKPAVPKAPPADAVADVLRVIVGMTDGFCRQHLNAEYAALCRRLAEKLARKRPSPLVKGKPETWAAGIVRTIGMLNFLDDRTQRPHMKLTAIDRAFGVGESTGQGKSMLIRKLLKIRQFDWHWILPSRLDDYSIIWMLTVNGFLMDIRHAPREAQEAAFEKGLIPYIPADRPERVRLRPPHPRPPKDGRA